MLGKHVNCCNWNSGLSLTKHRVRPLPRVKRKHLGGLGLCQNKRANFESTIQVSRLFQIVQEWQQQCVNNKIHGLGSQTPRRGRERVSPEPCRLGATERQENSPKACSQAVEHLILKGMWECSICPGVNWRIVYMALPPPCTFSVILWASYFQEQDQYSLALEKP